MHMAGLEEPITVSYGIAGSRYFEVLGRESAVLVGATSWSLPWGPRLFSVGGQNERTDGVVTPRLQAAAIAWLGNEPQVTKEA